MEKDENYDYIISTLYQLTSNALDEDKIENNKFKKGLNDFQTKELPRYLITVKSPVNYPDPIYKQYNLNTKYGRRKAKEQACLNYQNGSPEYRKKIDNTSVLVWVVIFVITIIIYFIKFKVAGKI